MNDGIDKQSMPLMFIGYAEEHNSWKLLDPKLNDIIILEDKTLALDDSNNVPEESFITIWLPGSINITN